MKVDIVHLSPPIFCLMEKPLGRGRISFHLLNSFREKGVDSVGRHAAFSKLYSSKEETPPIISQAVSHYVKPPRTLKLPMPRHRRSPRRRGNAMTGMELPLTKYIRKMATYFIATPRQAA